ncbi:MAG: transglutaminase-like domain-containing protein [Acidobacteriota bacterium]
MRVTRLIFLLAFFIWIGAAPLVADATALAERTERLWYQLSISGTPAGWMMGEEIVRADRRISATDMQIRVARGGVTIDLTMASRFETDLDGRPLRAWSRQKLGPSPVEVVYDFLDPATGVRKTQIQGDSTKETVVDWPAGDWLTPVQMNARLEAEIAAGGDGFTARVIDPSVGLNPIEIGWQRDGDETIDSVDGPIATSRWQQQLSYAPGAGATVHIDDAGRIVRSVTTMMGMEMALTLSTAEAAQAELGAPELLVQTFVYPDRPLPSPRAARRAVYDLRLDDAASAPDVPQIGFQRVSGAPGGGLRVTVDLDRPPLTAPAPGPKALATSIYLDHDHPDLVALRATALANLPPDETVASARLGATQATLPASARPRVIAETLRGFVHGHLREKGLDTVFATASDVAASGAGDCTEHAVLLTALLRGAGIPARVATGLISVEAFAGRRDLFGYHMWSQAYLDSAWVDLDATLDHHPYDAAHITLGTSLLDDETGPLGDLVGALGTLGALRIATVEIDTDGADEDLDADAAAARAAALTDAVAGDLADAPEDQRTPQRTRPLSETDQAETVDDPPGGGGGF